MQGSSLRDLEASRNKRRAEARDIGMRAGGGTKEGDCGVVPCAGLFVQGH